MRVNKKRITAVLTTGALVAALLAGCGSGKGTDSGNDATTKEKQKIVIATTGSGPEPYIYTDDSGELTGYDIELFKKIFEKLPQYEVEFEKTEFASIFTGIDAGYYQIGLNHLGFNQERAEKYDYTDVISSSTSAILVRDDEDDIKGTADLGGHSTEIAPASFYETFFLNYNEEHPDSQIELVYTDDSNNTPLHVSDGTIDFEYFTKETLEAQLKSYNLTNLKLIDVPADEELKSDTTIEGQYAVVTKENPQLLKDINDTYEKLISDGTVLELEKKYLGIHESDDRLTLEYVEENRQWIQDFLSK